MLFDCSMFCWLVSLRSRVSVLLDLGLVSAPIVALWLQNDFSFFSFCLMPESRILNC